MSAVVYPKPETDAFYDSLLPQPLRPAAIRTVGVWLVEVASGREVEGRPQDDVGNWFEGAIQLRCAFTAADGTTEEGWFPILYPVSAELWYHLGIAVGLPKLRADGGIVPGAGQVTGSSRARGAEGAADILMAWTPGELPIRETEEERARDAHAIALATRTAIDPFFVLSAPLEGPDLMRVQYTIAPPMPPLGWVPDGIGPYTGEPAPEVGPIHLSLNPDVDARNALGGWRDQFPEGLSLSDLVDTSQITVGTHQVYAVTLGSESEVVGQGGYDQ